jgi:hypothetical protein
MQSVYATASYVDAHVVAGFLAEHEVRAHVQGGEFGNIMARRLLNPAYRVLVEDSDRGRADDLIVRWKAGEFALEDDDADDASRTDDSR